MNVRYAEPDLTGSPDLALLQRFAAHRDESAFAEIVRRYAGVVFAACRRVLRDRALAEDVAQETFLRLMRRPDACSQSLGGWLHRSATRLALDARRSDDARRRREAAYETSGPGVGGAPGSGELVEVVAWREISPRIDAALASLPDDERDVLVAHFLQGRPQSELAVELGVSAATTSRRVKSAVESLRRELSRRGVAVGAAALATLCAVNAAEAAPAALVRELGKMSMLSGRGLAGTGYPLASSADAAGHAGSALLRTGTEFAGRVAPYARGLLWTALAIGAVAAVAVASADWLGFRWPRPAPPTPEAEHRPAMIPGGGSSQAAVRHVVRVPGPDNVDSTRAHSFEWAGPPTSDGLVNVVFNDGHAVALPAAEARHLILTQSGKTLDQLAVEQSAPAAANQPTTRP